LTRSALDCLERVGCRDGEGSARDRLAAGRPERCAIERLRPGPRRYLLGRMQRRGLRLGLLALFVTAAPSPSGGWGCRTPMSSACCVQSPSGSRGPAGVTSLRRRGAGPTGAAPMTSYAGWCCRSAARYP